MAVKEKELAVRIKAYRLLADGMSQEALGEAIGQRDNAISRYELGQVVPGLRHAVRIAQACGITVSDLIGDNLPGFDFDAAFARPKENVG